MFTVDWFKGNIKNWEKWLSELKGKNNLNFLEIGCFEGRATLWLWQNILTGQSPFMTVIDTFKGGMEDGKGGYYKNENVENDFKENLKDYLGSRMRIYKGYSQEILRREEFRFDKFDFVYLDGSHRSPEVLEDLILVWRLVKSGGIIILDDYQLDRYPDPKDNPTMAIDAFLSIFADKYELYGKGYQVALKKK